MALGTPRRPRIIRGKQSIDGRTPLLRMSSGLLAGRVLNVLTARMSMMSNLQMLCKQQHQASAVWHARSWGERPVLAHHRPSSSTSSRHRLNGDSNSRRVVAARSHSLSPGKIAEVLQSLATTPTEYAKGPGVLDSIIKGAPQEGEVLLRPCSGRCKGALHLGCRGRMNGLGRCAAACGHESHEFLDGRCPRGTATGISPMFAWGHVCNHEQTSAAAARGRPNHQCTPMPCADLPLWPMLCWQYAHCKLPICAFRRAPSMGG